jgi:hypothetical protein
MLRVGMLRAMNHGVERVFRNRPQGIPLGQAEAEAGQMKAESKSPALEVPG